MITSFGDDNRESKIWWNETKRSQLNCVKKNKGTCCDSISFSSAQGVGRGRWWWRGGSRARLTGAQRVYDWTHWSISPRLFQRCEVMLSICSCEPPSPHSVIWPANPHGFISGSSLLTPKCHTATRQTGGREEMRADRRHRRKKMPDTDPELSLSLIIYFHHDN